MISKLDDVTRGMEDLRGRVSRLESVVDKLSEVVTGEPPSPKRRNRGGARPRSPSPRGRPRSRSRQRSNRARSRDTKPTGVSAPISASTEMPAVHVYFEHGTPRWNETEARHFGETYGKVRRVYVPERPEDRWLLITFEDERERDECLYSDMVKDNYPGITLTRKTTGGSGVVGKE